jgi:hypothetical protein
MADKEMHEYAGIGPARENEVYMYYDRPLVLSLRDASGNLWLCLLVEWTSDVDEWLRVRVSPKRLAALVENRIGVRKAFTEPEDGWLLHVTERYGEEYSDTALRVPPDQLDEVRLPTHDALLTFVPGEGA